MAKIGIGRIFETSRARTTQAGQQLNDFIEFVSDFSEQTIRALNGQLTFSDNFFSLVQIIELPHNQDQVINTDGKIPAAIYVDRVISTELVTVSSFGWIIDENNTVTARIEYGNSTEAQNVRLTVFFS